MIFRALPSLAFLLLASGWALAEVQKPSAPAELRCGRAGQTSLQSDIEAAQQKGKERAQQACVTVRTKLRGHEATDQAEQACTEGYMRVEVSRMRLCGTYDYFMDKLDLPTAKPKQGYNPDDFKNYSGTAAKVVNERAHTGEMLNMFLKVGAKKVADAKKALNAAASKIGDQAQKDKSHHLTDRMELYRKGIEELGPLEKELERMQGLAAKLRDDFRKTAREIADLEQRSEEERKKLFSEDHEALERNLSDLKGEGKDTTGDSKFMAKQAASEVAKAGAEQAGLNGALGKTAAGTAAKSVLEAAAGDVGGIAGGAAKDVVSTYGKQALKDGVKAIPAVGVVMAPSVATGVGAAVTVLTSPTTANSSEVWLEEFLRSSSSSGIDYDGEPITYPTADLERRQEMHYLPRK